MKKIIICATARCGSTLLCKELEATGVLGQPKEYYIQAKQVTAEKAPIFWQNIIQKASSENAVFAIKVMQSQWLVAETIHQYLAQPPSLLATRLKQLKQIASFSKNNIEMDNFYSFYKEATWIFLRRKDKLYQAISREMARQTKVCHIIKPGASSANIGKALDWEQSSNYNQAAIYKAAALLTHLKEIEQEEQAWLAFFKQYKIQPLSLNYESLLTSKDYLTALAQRVSVELKGQPREMPLMQVRNELNDEWATRFRNEFPNYKVA